MRAPEYLQKKLFMAAMLVLIACGITVGLMMLTGKNIVTAVTGKGTLITNTMFVVVGLAALAIGFYRDTYLPFLGPAVFPCALLQPSTPEAADYEVRVLVKPGAKVMYWAAEPQNKELESLQDWRKAYLGFRNAGVAVADQDGYVTLRVRKPQSYMVGFKGQLDPHIHYRVCADDGMIGRVETVKLDGKEYFADYKEKRAEHFVEAGDDALHHEEPAMPPAEEGFANYKPEYESVPETDRSLVEPDRALEEINAVVQETARRSLMTEVGAMDESIGGRTDRYAQAAFM
jgi:uncharacterized membrane protein YuzA (DUF378 family)